MSPPKPAGKGCPTPRQLTFARSYLWTGSAAEAARAAGYTGRYAAQAGYKLLMRAGTQAALAELMELERVHLRRQVLRALKRVREVVQPQDVPLAILERMAVLLADLMELGGLANEPTYRALAAWLAQAKARPRLRRLPPLDWRQTA